MHKIGPLASFRRIATGTPDPKDYVDYFSQYKFLDPRTFGTRVTGFRERYIIPHPFYPSKVASYVNTDELKRKMYGIASRVRQEDCFDMPEVLEIKRTIILSEEQRKEYALAKASSSNHLDAITKCQQYLSYLKTGEVLAELEKWVEANLKAVIFCRFREENERLVLAIRKQYSNIPVLQFFGGTSDNARDSVLQMCAPGNQVGAGAVVCSVGLGIGISLAGASVAIVTSPDFDYSHYDQSLARIWKPSQRIVHVLIQAKDTVDDQLIFPSMRRKRNISEELLRDLGWDDD